MVVHKENGYSYFPVSESINTPHCFLLGRWNVQIYLFLQVVADLLNTFYYLAKLVLERGAHILYPILICSRRQSEDRENKSKNQPYPQ